MPYTGPDMPGSFLVHSVVREDLVQEEELLLGRLYNIGARVNAWVIAVAVHPHQTKIDDRAWDVPDGLPSGCTVPDNDDWSDWAWRITPRYVEKLAKVTDKDDKRLFLLPGGKPIDPVAWKGLGRANAPKLNDFPHKCPCCGKAAYCGLFEVTHMDEVAAMKCTARRDSKFMANLRTSF